MMGACKRGLFESFDAEEVKCSNRWAPEFLAALRAAALCRPLRFCRCGISTSWDNCLSTALWYHFTIHQVCAMTSYGFSRTSVPSLKLNADEVDAVLSRSLFDNVFVNSRCISTHKQHIPLPIFSLLVIITLIRIFIHSLVWWARSCGKASSSDKSKWIYLCHDRRRLEVGLVLRRPGIQLYSLPFSH